MNRAGTVKEKVELWKADVQLALVSDSDDYLKETAMLENLINEGLVKSEEIDTQRKIIIIQGVEIDYNLDIPDTSRELESDEGKESMILTFYITDFMTIDFNYYYERYNYDFDIDWGDNNIEHYDNQTLSENPLIMHTYDKNGEYDIKIDGICQNLNFYGDSRLLKIKQWGTTNLLDACFEKCSNLAYIASPTKSSFRNIKSFAVMFDGCKNLKEIPSNLFVGCENAINFERTFMNCESLKEIPENLFLDCNNVTNFYGTFAGCSNLEGEAIELWERVENGKDNGYIGIPEGQACYYGCSKLNNYESIPDYWKSSLKPV